MITLDIAAFRTLFTAFANTTTYPDATITMFWDTAANYVSNADYGELNSSSREYALQLMTAHLLALQAIVSRGQTPSMVNSSTIDKISVSLTVAPVKNQWQWWLNLTAYGQQLLALLQVKAVGGLYIGGLPERAAFRKVGGIF
jgi:hypothetical protein